MGIEMCPARKTRVAVVLLVSLVCGVRAAPTTTAPVETDSLIRSAVERVDTIRIRDTVWIPTSVIDTALDSAAWSRNNSARIRQLHPITVHAKRPTGADDATRPTVVDGEQIRTTSRATPIEELSQQSGDTYVTSKGTGLHGVASGASGGIYICGLGGSPNSQILVVEDGAPDYQGIFGHPIPDAFFPSLIGRVMVIKGGDGVLYGTNALGGVIVIEDRRPDSSGMRLENDVSYGSFNAFRERATVLVGGRTVDAASAFSAFTTDGHYDGNDGNCVTGQLGVRLRLPRSATVVVRDKVIHIKGADPGPWQAPFSPRRGFDVGRNNLSARLDVPGAWLRARVVSWLDAGEHRLWDGFFSRDYTGGATAECSGTLLDRRLQLLLGAAGEYVHGRAVDRTLDSGDAPIPSIDPMSSMGLFGQVTVKPGLGLTGVVGGRLHYSAAYGQVPLYKFGLHWQPVDRLEIHSRFTKNFRQPTLRELYLPFPVANPSLRPETARNWDAGAELTLGKVQLSGTVFRTSVTDMIKYFGVWSGAEVVNVDYLRIWGVEGSCTLEHLGPFNAFLAASRQDVGRFTRQNPDAKVNGRISFISERGSGRLELAVTGEWVHGLYMNNYGRNPLPNVSFLDGSVRYRMRSKGGVRLEPYCIVRNLLNARYAYIENYRMPGINFLVGIAIGV
jgi:outer membrane cobalamin receptor